MKGKLKQIKLFNWRLFIALCTLSLIPAIYQTIRTFIISSNTDSSAFDVIGQMEWFDLINETLQAFLIIPLYSILNKIYKEQNENFGKYTFKTGLIACVLYALFSIAVLIYGFVLVTAMNPSEVDLTVANQYLQLETIAFIINIVVSFVNVVFVVVGKDKNVYIFLIANTVLTIMADLLLIPNLGVYGVAVSNIIVNLLLSIVSISLLVVEHYLKPNKFTKSDLPIFKQWCKVGVFSGLQQFLDNLIYAIMVCKMVNMVAEQGNYWIANNFIWGWLLIPITALGEVIRRDCSEKYLKLKQFNYYFVAVVTIILWAATIPTWTSFYRYVENLSNASEIFLITIKLVPFYIAYAGCAIIDNIFIGVGKTIYNAINSLIINLVYYGIFYILYLTGAITFTMDVIIIMFGCGMVVHLAISIIEEKLFLRRFELKKL